MTKARGSKRRQAGLGSELTRKINTNKAESSLILGRVVHINYDYNTIDFLNLTTGSTNAKGTSDGGQSSARLPVSFGGQNGYGNTYGELNPIRINDIVLIGFINDNKSSPIVISRYLSNRDAVSMSSFGDSSNDMAANDEELYGVTNRYFKIMPDQTYEYSDGDSTYMHTFSGKSFISSISKDLRVNGTITDNLSSQYEKFESSHFNDGSTIEPVNFNTPRILFEHIGKFDEDEEPDYHLFHAMVDGDGMFRLSNSTTDEQTWDSFFEMDSADGSITLKRQNKKDLGFSDISDTNSYFNIDKGNNISIVSGKTKMFITDDFHIYAMDSQTGNNKVDLYQNALLTNNSLKSVNDDLENLQNTANSSSSSISTMNDQINLSASSISQTNSIASSTYGGATNSINMFSTSGAIHDTKIDETSGNLQSSSGYLSYPQQSAIRNFNYSFTAYSVNKDITLSMFFYDLNHNFIKYATISGNSGDVSLSAVAPDATMFIAASISTASFKVKLEQAEKYTNWSPAIADLYSDTATVNDLLTQAKSNQAKITSTLNSIDTTKTEKSLLDLDTNNEIKSENKETLKEIWKTVSSYISSISSLGKRYSVSVVNMNNYFTSLDTSITKDILADMTTDSPSTNFSTNVNYLFYETNICIKQILVAVNNAVTTSQNIKDKRTASYRNYLVGTTSPNTSYISGRLYKFSQGILELSGSTILVFDYYTSDVNANFNIDEVIYTSDGKVKSSTTLVKDLPNNSKSGHIATQISPIIPTSEQSAYLYINYTNYRQPVTISNAMITVSSDTDITWVIAPEDINSTTSDKMSTFKVQSDQITSAVFDQLLGESDIFTQTAKKAELAVTTGSASAGLTVEDGKLTFFGKEIDILGDIVDNNKIIGSQLTDVTVSSTTNNFAISAQGAATNMSLAKSVISSTTFNLSNQGLLSGMYSLKDSTSVFNPISSSGNFVFDNNGITGTGTFQSYDNNSWGGYNNSGVKDTSTTNSFKSTINPAYLSYSILDTSGVNLVSTKITPDKISASDFNSTVYLDYSGIHSNLNLALEGKSIVSKTIYGSTSSDSANVVIDSSGNLKRVSSAIRYKTNIEEIPDIIDTGKKLLEAVPKKWQDKAELSKTGKSDEYVGLIAEDLEKLGLSDFLSYKEGKLESIKYDRLFILLLPLIKKLVDKENI